MKAEKKLLKLQKKVAKFSEKIQPEINAVCEMLDYHNSSRLGRSIDRIILFNVEIQDFKIIGADDNTKVVKLQFRGIDNFNRPVYKNVDSTAHYGSVDKLYSNNYLDDNKIEKVKGINDFFRKNIHLLEFFGNTFGCEPNGGISPNIKLVII